MPNKKSATPITKTFFFIARIFFFKFFVFNSKKFQFKKRVIVFHICVPRVFPIMGHVT